MHNKETVVVSVCCCSGIFVVVCGASVNEPSVVLACRPQGSSNLHFVLSAAILSTREFQFVDLFLLHFMVSIYLMCLVLPGIFVVSVSL
jgi:hypothetical protein